MWLRGATGEDSLGELEGLGCVEHEEDGERVSHVVLRDNDGGMVQSGRVLGGQLGDVLVRSQLADHATSPVDLEGGAMEASE